MSGNLAARKLKVAELSARIFGNNFNPTNARTGHYIIRKPLAGETIYSWYPRPEMVKRCRFKRIDRAFPELSLFNLDEEERLDTVERLKRRGKGAPKKGEGRRATLGKKK
ncbi:mitochondral 37S ribosomal protein S27 [Spiromyces aspiralis]|uniref:Mitochondral 37S ribosomal protein S27 n=1 Tax=Spiromyces aspiralis TaxID=68401 RepID=A0ACC1HFY5_9FUNG|nr:mitochondral 37S ribosomal protein S27 [Spiromyces aspiralis]